MTRATDGDGNRPATPDPAGGPDDGPAGGPDDAPREPVHGERPGAPMGAAEWDQRYAGTDLVWGAGANRWVIEQVANLAPARAVDLACGEGRNAVYLAERGWHVTGVDFSAVAIDKARRLAESRFSTAAGSLRWECADITGYRPDPVELAVVAYVHLLRGARVAVLAAAVGALVPGGSLLVIGHNTRNVTEGTGGPQDSRILYTADDIVTDLAGIDAALVVDVASEPLRRVEGAPRPAIDTVVRVHRP